MPSEKLEKSPKNVIEKFKMDPEIRPNNSQQDLVHNSEDVSDQTEQTLRNVKFRDWIAVIILCFVNLINYMDRFTIAGVLTDLQKDFNIRNDKGGLLQTAFILSYMLFAPIFGYCGDRYSRRWLMAGGVFIWSITTLCGSFMTNYWWFLLFRAFVGLGEASYSTIAPTIISDLFVGNLRSKMLAMFYFAIPVGSGLGYIVGSETAKLAGSWHWALRVTPGLGIAAVILIIFVLNEPKRGQSECSGHLNTTPWIEDVKDLIHNRSFMLSTAGFTCVAFVTGALSWWGPKFIEMGLKLQPNTSDFDPDNVSYKFGVISMIAGLAGVPAGNFVAQKLRYKYARIDAHICAFGLLVSSPLIYLALVAARYSSPVCFSLVFFAMFFLNLNWSLVADILLYVVLPTRRSTAGGFQLLVSHALGDAGSPYLIGVISEAFKIHLSSNDENTTTNNTDLTDFQSLQYALFITCFVEIIGGLFFLINSFYIVQDKCKVENAVHGTMPHELCSSNSNHRDSMVDNELF